MDNDIEVEVVVSVSKAAALLGISRAFAYELVTRGELPAVRLGRQIIVPRRAIDALLDAAARSAHPDT